MVLSYLFDLAAEATKVPSVLLLLLAGITFGQAPAYWRWPVHFRRCCFKSWASPA